jgi:vacuolar-type H+-ATPase subunit E/Vma4
MTGLEPVRMHHLAAARAQADAMLSDARAQAERILAGAATDAETLIAQAKQEGEEAAALDTSHEWINARRRARSIILAARRDAFDHLRAAAAVAVRSDPRYPALLERLADIARRQLGPGAVVNADPYGERGVSATRKGRHVDVSLANLVEQSLERLGPAVEELWR